MHDNAQHRCDLCRMPVIHGPRRYDGHWIKRYQMFLCHPCFAGNWDGIGPMLEPLFRAHLTKHGIEVPQRNEKGGIPEVISDNDREQTFAVTTNDPIQSLGG